MAKDQFNEILMNETLLGNSSGMYKAKFLQVGPVAYQLQIFKVIDGTKQTETIKKEPVKVEVEKIRPVMLKGLKTEEYEKRLKALERYLKDTPLKEALKFDSKKKALKAQIDLNFEVEKIFVEEIELVEVPLIKTEVIQELKKEVFLDYYTPLKPKEVRRTVENYLNS